MELFIPSCNNKSISANSKNKYRKQIRQLLSNKSRTWRAIKANPSNTNLIEKYKQLTSKVKDALRSHEIEKETKIINSENIGTFYKYVNRKMSHPSGIGVLYDNNCKPTIDDNKKAEILYR